MEQKSWAIASLLSGPKEGVEVLLNEINASDVDVKAIGLVIVTTLLTVADRPLARAHLGDDILVHHEGVHIGRGHLNAHIARSILALVKVVLTPALGLIQKLPLVPLEEQIEMTLLLHVLLLVHHHQSLSLQAQK